MHITMNMKPEGWRYLKIIFIFDDERVGFYYHNM